MVLEIAGMGCRDAGGDERWDAMLYKWMGGPVGHSLVTCSRWDMVGHAVMVAGMRHWDAGRRSLGIRMESSTLWLWVITEMRRDVWELTVIGTRNRMDEIVQGSVIECR